MPSFCCAHTLISSPHCIPRGRATEEGSVLRFNHIFVTCYDFIPYALLTPSAQNYFCFLLLFKYSYALNPGFRVFHLVYKVSIL